MNIVRVEKAQPWVLEGLNALLPQLTETFSRLSPQMLEDMARSESVSLWIAVQDRRILGCIALVVFRIPTGVRARIEDLVVDASVRGLGLGERLVRRAIAQAQRQGADAVELTSNPQRAAADRLYRKIGFDYRETNTYRYAIADH